MNLALQKFVALVPGLMAVLLAGCATPLPSAHQSSALSSLPTEGLVTQRAVLTVHGRQFVLNGYLSQSKTGARRLVVTEMFGHVLADVLVKPDAAVRVMRSGKPFKPAWIERYVAGDMQCVFGGHPASDCPVRMLSANHFVVERRWYKLDLQIVQTQAGPQPPELFEATPGTK